MMEANDHRRRTSGQVPGQVSASEGRRSKEPKPVSQETAEEQERRIQQHQGGEPMIGLVAVLWCPESELLKGGRWKQFDSSTRNGYFQGSCCDWESAAGRQSENPSLSV
jgi:hypothetical protein